MKRKAGNGRAANRGGRPAVAGTHVGVPQAPGQQVAVPGVAGPGIAGPGVARPGGSATILAIVLLVVAAYATSFGGDFVFDDVNEIVTNPALRELPPWRAMFVGKTLPARPLPYLSFALNSRVGAANPFGYHVVNLAIHLVAALALCDLVRTTLESPRLREEFGRRAVPLAGLVAAIWAVHPLQTQAVTYVYQRIESMTGMFVLVSLAAWARAGVTGWQPRWAIVAVAAAAAAMASKENAVILPVAAVLYDWCFWPGESRRSRLPWYAALAATWLILAAHLWLQRHEFQEFEPGRAAALAYLATQGGVILHYLAVAAWPVRQCIDYGWPIAAGWSALPACAVVASCLAVTCVGIVRRRPWAFPAAFFFLALAPTSSILPVAAAAAEHRMYLPLAGVVSLVALAADAAVRRARPGSAGITAGWPAVAALVVIGSLAVRTLDRNRVYAEPERLWAEAVAMNPGNDLAQARLAEVLFARGDVEEAIAHAEEAMRINPASDVVRGLVLACKRPDQLPIQERLARREVEIRSAAFGPEGRETLESVARLVAVLRNAGRPEGIERARTALPAMERVLGPDDLSTLSTRVILAQGLLAAGDAAAAERLAAATLASLERSADRPAALAAAAMEVLTESLRRQGREATGLRDRSEAGEMRQPAAE